ncbi:hypothetical protein BO82DRAFT_49794 [Aspergillus uvarum CBS 121591]|uniref:Uncharacterized protein n=1 Tax=Aspergillus uvarum CBS 121591 TaxID=1448315 RepID=A0A319CF08_9EURO|nr:hypothetical protein BO82DRAFT_49794 [Aspergillus uvarum CBS 121591]PYH83020.1 hypothetical protein BO82DRAFT_49794 [Aspergillus uvarum CBS 121591]
MSDEDSACSCWVDTDSLVEGRCVPWLFLPPLVSPYVVVFATFFSSLEVPDRPESCQSEESTHSLHSLYFILPSLRAPVPTPEKKNPHTTDYGLDSAQQCISNTRTGVHIASSIESVCGLLKRREIASAEDTSSYGPAGCSSRWIPFCLTVHNSGRDTYLKQMSCALVECR